jgi:hypothetical protein
MKFNFNSLFFSLSPRKRGEGRGEGSIFSSHKSQNKELTL